MPTLSRSTARRVATILLILLTAAACSGGGASSPAGASTAPAGSQAPAAASAAAGSPSSLHTMYCNAIKLPDAQVLLKDTITEDNFDPLEVTPPFDCTLLTSGGGDYLTVSIATSDTFASWVAEENAGTGNALTGVGDKAVWVQDPTLANAPIVVAINGSVTCRVRVPPTEKTTIEFTNPNGVDHITAAAAASFAQKMAVLCTDVFGASS